MHLIKKEVLLNFRFTILLVFVCILCLPQISQAQISGPSNVCIGSTITLTCSGSGTWSSSLPAVGSISTSGVVTGILPGSTVISCGGFATTIVVNPLPSYNTVTGGGSYCAGGTGLHIGLSGTSSGISYQLYNGLSTVGAPLTGSGAPLDFGFITGAGTYTVVATNPTTSCSSTMTGSATITINPVPSTITGPTALCVGGTGTLTTSPAGGTWSSSLTSIATVGTSGTVTGAAPGNTSITYTLPVTGCSTTSIITVTTTPCPLSLPAVCLSTPATLTDCISGGVWSSNTTAVATVGSLSGIVSGSSVGIDTITYSLGSTGCTVTATLAVISAPAAIAGPSSTCSGSTITLSDGTPSGTWGTSNAGIATVSSSGVVTGAAAGVVTISYTIGSCSATKTITVSALPATIGGPSSVCMGSSITETDTTTGGTWSISPSWLASVGSSSGIVTGIGAGIATLTYSPGGCQATKTITINASSPITGFPGTCVGATTILSDAFTGGTWSSATTSVATVTGVTGVVSGIAAGTSVITYNLSSGCFVTTTVTVSPYPGPISGPPYFCNGACIYLSAGIAGGTWSSSIPALASVDPVSGSACGLAPGSVTFTYLAGGCSASATLTVNPTPPAISGPATICSGASVAYTDVFSGGTWSSSTPAVATIGSTTGSATGISSGTAILSYSLSTGCTAILPVNVYPFSVVTGPSSVCIGQTITLSDAVAGGSWSSSSPAIATVNSSGIVTGVASGSATITYSLPGGCTATALITVNGLPSPVSGPHTVCVSSAITLTDATPGGVWSSMNTSIATIFGTSNIAGISAGVDTIHYGIPGGCFTIFTVTVNPIPDSISGPGKVCVGGAISLSDPSPFGSWTSSAPAIAGIGSSTGSVTGLATGSAIISYSFPTGCHVTKSVTVNLPPSAISGSTSICPGGISLLADATPGGSWSSSNPSVATINPLTGVLSGVTPGTAVISYSIGSGCVVTTSVTVNPLPATISGSTLICQGSSVTLTDLTPGGTWSSSNPAIATAGPGGIITGVSAGTATIDYILSTGCMSEIGMIVDPTPAPISGIPLVCVGLITSLSDASPGGSWSSSNPAIAPVSISGTVTGLTAGTVHITYTAVTGCISTVIVGVNNPPTAISGASLICETTSALFTDGVPGGEWISSNGAVAAAGSTSGIITGLSTGIATITYMTGAGCQLTKNITVNPIPMPISGPGSICTGIPFTITDATTGGVWASSAPTLASIGSSSGIVVGLAAGIVSISYTLGCTITHLITVNIMPSLITGPAYTCTGGTIVLSDSVSGGTWTSSTPSVAAIGSATGIVTGLSTGTSTIDYTMPGGCLNSSTITITNPPSLFTITGGGNYCVGDSGVHIGLSGSEPGVNYLLYRGTTPTGTFPGTGAALDFGWQTVTGTYTVTATNILSLCSMNMTGMVTVNILPVVVPHISITSIPGDTICSGTIDSFTAHPVNGGTTPVFQWQVNGVNVGTGMVYSYLPVNGDIVKIKLASSAACAVPDTVYKSDTITVHPSANPSVSISATPGDTVCKGTVVTFSETNLYGGTAPVYTWVKNGVVAGSGALYSCLPANNDIIYCIMQSNYSCRLSDRDTSSHMTITVDTPSIPVVTIFATPGSSVIPGQIVTLTAIATNGGIAPSWQWFKNGVLIPGATSSTYVIDTFSTPQTDSFSCQITSSGPCILTSEQNILINVTTVGIIKLSQNNFEVKILPNPNNGEFTLTGTTGLNDLVSIAVTDMPGQLIYKSEVHNNNGILNEQLRLGHILAKGTYVLTVRTTASVRVFQLVIEE